MVDLGTVAAAVLRPAASLGLRDERIAISLRLIGSLLDDRTRAADVSPDLAREALAADANAQATLILPPGPGPARIEVAGRQFVVTGSLRDALLEALKQDNTAPRGNVPNPLASAADKGSELRLVTQALVAATSPGVAAPVGTLREAAAVTTLAASGTLRAARNQSDTTDTTPTVPFDKPVFDPRDPTATAAQLAARVRGSGVFFEAHVAQWARGERSAEAVRAEAADLARVATQDPTRAEARGTLQVETLQRQAIALAGPAWRDQPMLLELGRDPQAVRDAEAHGGPVDPVFAARLHLELPHLGALEVRLRLAGDRIAAAVESGGAASVAHLAAALPEFRLALEARGLQPVLLQALQTGDGSDARNADGADATGRATGQDRARPRAGEVA
jgi:hypothetical protein